MMLLNLHTVFAIQKCDPAPFYLFDEVCPLIDSAHGALLMTRNRLTPISTLSIVLPSRVSLGHYVVSNTDTTSFRSHDSVPGSHCPVYHDNLPT